MDGDHGKVRRDGCCVGPPVRPLLILATRCRSWRQVDLQKLILATCCRIQWTSCSPVADPGDTLSQLVYGDCGCSCWWHVATVVDSKFRMLILSGTIDHFPCMLINVALLAADGEDVVPTSPPCWWTRHESTAVQRDKETSSTSPANHQEEEGSIESTEVKKF